MTGQRATLRVLVLVKASPVLTASLEESMCVAALDLDGEQWVRLHPVPFRDLDDGSKFAKFQEVTVDAIRPRTDRRPESWTPIEGTVRLGARVGTDRGWSRRRELVASLGERTMCELAEANREGSGGEVPSLAVVRTAEPPELEITERDEEQVRTWTGRAEAIAARPSLFDDPEQPKHPLEVIPWRFRYRYRCLASGCNGHAQTIVDWEAVALFRRVRNRRDWQQLMRERFVDEMWASDRDAVLFVGNQHQHPASFLVLGIFWPPTGGVQQSLL